MNQSNVVRVIMTCTCAGAMKVVFSDDKNVLENFDDLFTFVRKGVCAKGIVSRNEKRIYSMHYDQGCVVNVPAFFQGMVQDIFPDLIIDDIERDISNYKKVIPIKL